MKEKLFVLGITTMTKQSCLISLAQTLLLTLLILALPATAHAPMKHIPPKPKVEQRAKQEAHRVMFEVTAYTSHDFSMNGKGITASGVRAKRWHTVAASRGIPFGTRIFFPALGKTFVVQDRGGAIHGNRIDLYVGNRAEALKFGRKRLEGVVLYDSNKIDNSSLHHKRGK